MLKVRTLFFASLLATTWMMGGVASAADPVANSSEIVQYRLEKWKTTHAGSQSQSDKLVATLKKLRCEVKVSSHGGHTDVNYRCPKWQKLALRDHATAHQWEQWLKKRGFETKHVH